MKFDKSPAGLLPKSVIEGASSSPKRNVVPHPIPYQGSKRKLISSILPLMGGGTHTLYEPFCGSAAVTLAAASGNLAQKFVLNDSLKPLSKLWAEIVTSPAKLADEYHQIWHGHVIGSIEHYNSVRASFNEEPSAAKLLYLLARCVKSAVRFNDKGKFNQSADKRRLGTQPKRMRQEIIAAHRILDGKTVVLDGDYVDSIGSAGPDDLVYMDPPWEGTSGAKDTRYHQLLDKGRLIDELAVLNSRRVPYLLSFDGRLGNKTYGEALPSNLSLVRLEINAGRSSQSTLSGGTEDTYESLYLSPALMARLEKQKGTAVVDQLMRKAA